MTYLDKDKVRIGIDLAQDGSITFASNEGHPRNIIKSADLDRQIQISHYSGTCPFEVVDKKPYPVEVGPQGGQAQLSSESALYCRIFTEGLFGILPTGLDRFRCTPRLPDGWSRMALRSIRAFGDTWDLVVGRRGAKTGIVVEQAGKHLFEHVMEHDREVEIVLP